MLTTNTEIQQDPELSLPASRKDVLQQELAKDKQEGARNSLDYDTVIKDSIKLLSELPSGKVFADYLLKNKVEIRVLNDSGLMGNSSLAEAEGTNRIEISETHLKDIYQQLGSRSDNTIKVLLSTHLAPILAHETQHLINQKNFQENGIKWNVSTIQEEVLGFIAQSAVAAEIINIHSISAVDKISNDVVDISKRDGVKGLESYVRARYKHGIDLKSVDREGLLTKLSPLGQTLEDGKQGYTELKAKFEEALKADPNMDKNRSAYLNERIEYCNERIQSLSESLEKHQGAIDVLSSPAKFDVIKNLYETSLPRQEKFLQSILHRTSEAKVKELLNELSSLNLEKELDKNEIAGGHYLKLALNEINIMQPRPSSLIDQLKPYCMLLKQGLLNSAKSLGFENNMIALVECFKVLGEDAKQVASLVKDYLVKTDTLWKGNSSSDPVIKSRFNSALKFLATETGLTKDPEIQKIIERWK